MGIDGSGKTEHSDLLINELRQKGQKCKYAHIRMGVFRFFSLPFLLVWKLVGLPTESYHPLMKNYISMFVLWSWLFLMDYQLFYIALTFPNIPSRKSKTIHVFDRYMYDAIVDLNIIRGNSKFVENASTRAFFKIFPKPSIAILLDVDPKNAIARKGDTETHKLSYLVRRRVIYLELAKQLGFKLVNANKDFKSVHNELLNLVNIKE